MAKEPNIHGKYKYGQAAWLREDNQSDGLDTDSGLPIQLDGTFDFNGDNFETPREIRFAEPEPHPLLRSKK